MTYEYNTGVVNKDINKEWEVKKKEWFIDKDRSTSDGVNLYGGPGPTHICYFDDTNAVCLGFYKSVGFGNFWLGYLIVLGSCLLLSAIYASIVFWKLPHLKTLIKWHIGIFLVNITSWYWIPVFIFTTICQVHLFCGFNILAVILVIACVIITPLDLYYAPEAKYFRNQKQAVEALELLERIRAAKPTIGLYIKSFHHENWGKHTFKKVTFREKRKFQIDGFQDVSQIPSRINDNGVTLLNLHKTVTPGDEFSQIAFHQFKNRYIAANNHRDQAMNTEIEVSIPELSTEQIMAFSGRPPWWGSRFCFYFFSCLNISILLRIMLISRSTVYSILIKKVYFVDPSIQRTFDFDTGLVGPTVVHNFVMSPQQAQPIQSGYVPAPAQFGQPHFAAQPRHQRRDLDENRQFLKGEVGEDAPPMYEEHHKFPAMT